MTEKKSDTRWQLTMKNGGNVTFDVTAHDDTDTDIEEWMGELENGYDGVIKVTLGSSQIWVNLEDLSMACRTEIEKFNKVEEIPACD